MLLLFLIFGRFTIAFGSFLCILNSSLAISENSSPGKAVLVFAATRLMKWRYNPIRFFFTHDKNRIGLVIGYTIFFTCEENRMTNRIAAQKWSDDFNSKRL